MTRDEAQEKLCSLGDSRHHHVLDVLEALGLLTFDAPKGPNERAIDAMFGRGTGGMITPRHALDAIHAAGLKIVEA